VALLLSGVGLLGCDARQKMTVAETLPHAGRATPWVLVGDVWVGDIAGASESLGDEAGTWRALNPKRVWLAAYVYDTNRLAQLSVCVFEFDTPQAAEAILTSMRPADHEPFNAGDEGFWTRDGVRFRWGRLIFDVFGNQPNGLARAEQAAYLVGFIEKQMPPGLPLEPR
jgi:hypothetical protein